ncbi:MAG: hypothetical protein MPJ79_00570 [Alphaproteobacteria bacterium]|nr:hypothetical protein [Alphaproteobacteria bacterium]MDA7988127.1 hypothetical protein [Alphaproteobacteria bacterium]
MSEKRSGEREGKQEWRFVRLWRLFKESWKTPPWRVGRWTFGGGFAVWTLLCLTIMPSEAYWTGLVLIILSGPATGFTYWRGQQTEKQIRLTSAQIKKAQDQIKETQRQARFQSFDRIIEMAADSKNQGRQLAGWKRLERWFTVALEQKTYKGGRDRLEDWQTFADVTSDMVGSVLIEYPTSNYGSITRARDKTGELVSELQEDLKKEPRSNDG